MNKKVCFILSLLFLMSAPTHANEKQMPDNICAIIKLLDNPGTGLVLRDYNHPKETLRIEGVEQGAVVINVLVDSVADKKQFPVGVVITKIDSAPVEAVDDVPEILRQGHKNKASFEYISKRGRFEKVMPLERASDKENPCLYPDFKYDDKYYLQ